MLYNISKLNRTVELSDELVSEYTKHDELREHSFSIVVKAKFGHAPSADEISDEEGSESSGQNIRIHLKV